MMDETTFFGGDFDKRGAQEIQKWDELALSSFLRMQEIAAQDPGVHGPNLTEKLRTVGTMTALSPGDAWKRMFGSEEIENFVNLVLSETVLSMSEYQALKQDENFYPHARRVLDDASKRGLHVDQIRFVLYANGSEVIFVQKESREFRVHAMKQTSLTESEIKERISVLAGLIPPVEFSISQSKESKKNDVLLLSERIAGKHVLDKEKVIQASRNLAQKSGFIPDVHNVNFIESQGSLIYVDEDILEHVLSGDRLSFSEDQQATLDAELEEYRKLN